MDVKGLRELRAELFRSDMQRRFNEVIEMFHKGEVDMM